METNSQMKLTIPKPCSENWAEMSMEKEGRYCSSCNTTVHDFSFLSDEAMLLFFRNNPTVSCGRFHKDQLNRVLKMPEKNKERNRLRKSFKKIIATFFTFLSLKSIGANGAIHNRPSYILPGAQSIDDSDINENVVLSGIVKDEFNAPLAGVAIFFNAKRIMETDSNGYYSFKLNESDLQGANNIITFSYGGYITAVRSYHVAMQSTDYNVKMELPAKGIIMGGIAPQIVIEVPVIKYKPTLTNLDKSKRDMLDVLATALKNNPNVTIVLTSYSDVCDRKGHIYIKRLDIARDYLIRKHGISPDRIMTNIEVGGGELHLIDVIQQ